MDSPAAEASTKQKYFVQLTSLENAFLKSGALVLMGALAQEPSSVALGAIAGRAYLEQLGLEGLNELVKRLEAHRLAAKDDGTTARITDADLPLPAPTPEGNDVG